jgi:hypothetical protein
LLTAQAQHRHSSLLHPLLAQAPAHPATPQLVELLLGLQYQQSSSVQAVRIHCMSPCCWEYLKEVQLQLVRMWYHLVVPG